MNNQFITKDEFVQLHILFAQVREYLQKNSDLDNQTIANFFIKYDDLDVKPTDVYKTRKIHKQATYLLGASIVELMNYLNPHFPKDSKPSVCETLHEPYLVSAGIK